MSDSTNQNTAFDHGRIVRETFVERVQYHEIIASTNDAALELCRASEFREPVLVLTSQQTAGRGRGANLWWSAAGSLTFSVVLRPADWGLAEESWPKASLTTGLAVCLAVDELLPNGELSLKWPNDVHLGGRKVCGVLVEIASRPAGTLVVGIGLNVNNSFGSAPDDLQETATSLFDATGNENCLTDVLVHLLVELETQWSRLAADDPGLAADWQSRCALKGRRVEIGTGDQQTTGLCHGIDEDGALLVRTSDGFKQVFGGVVSRIW